MYLEKDFQDVLCAEQKYLTDITVIYIPFEGDARLLKHCPNTCKNLPYGEFDNKNIEFDVVLDTEDYTMRKVQENQESIEWHIEKSNDQVKEFNEQIADKITKAVKNRCCELQNHDYLDKTMKQKK